MNHLAGTEEPSMRIGNEDEGKEKNPCWIKKSKPKQVFYERRDFEEERQNRKQCDRPAE